MANLLDEAARRPPNRFTDVIGGRERRLLVLGLQRTLGRTAAPAGKEVTIAPDAPRSERTALRLLSCLRSVQGVLARARREQRLLGLVFSYQRSGLGDDEKEEDRGRLTPTVLAEAQLRDLFWQPYHGSCLRKRELPLARRGDDEEEQDSGAEDGSSLGELSPVSGSQPERMLPPVRRGKRRDGTFRVLSGFKTAEPGSPAPAPQARGARKAKSTVSLEDVVAMLKEQGVWDGPRTDLADEGAKPPSVPRSLTRSLTAGSLPPVPVAPSHSGSQCSGSGSTRSLHATKDLDAMTLRVFPALAKREPMPTKTIEFISDEAERMKRRVLLLPAAKATGEVEGGLLDAFSPGLARLVMGDRPPRPKLPMQHPVDRHPPSWIVGRNVSELLGPANVYAEQGAKPAPRFEADVMETRSSPQSVWLTSCSDAGCLPRAPRPIVEAAAAAGRGQDRRRHGDTRCRLDLGRQGLEDTALEALGECLPCLGHLEALSLAGNKLSSVAMGHFLTASLAVHGQNLKDLDLSWNRSLGAHALTALTGLIQNGSLKMLEGLHISGVAVPERCWEPMLEVLHESRLRTLSAADTRLGFRRQSPTVELLGKLVGDSQLTSVDVSGNYFLREGCRALGKALCETVTVTSLDVSQNSGDCFAHSNPAAEPPAREEGSPATEDEFSLASSRHPPVLAIIEGLLRNRTLESLSLAGCNLEYAADFLIGEALLKHPKLRYLDLSSNPHGAEGLACLLRGVAVKGCRLQHFNVADLRLSAVAAPSVPLRWQDPSGSYDLNLWHPQHRGVLRTLLARAADGKKAAESFSEIQPSSASVENWSKVDAYGIADVPKEGTVRFKFTDFLPDPPADAGPLAKAHGRFLRGHTPLGLLRAAPIVAAMETCGSDAQRSIFLSALSDALQLKAAHVALFIRSYPSGMSQEVLRSLLPVANNLRAEQPCGVTGLRNKAVMERRESEAVLRSDTQLLVLFNPNNPTARYQLDLSKACDRAIATRVQSLVAFEVELQAKSGCVDVSQLGNFEPARNVQHEGYDFLRGQAENRFAALSLPPSGTLKLDYVSRVPAPGSRGGSDKATPDAVVDRLCSQLSSARRLPWKEALQAFRSVSDSLVLSAAAVRKLAVCLALHAARESPAAAEEAAAEMLIACFSRCNERTRLVSAEGLHDPTIVSPGQAEQLWPRLGACHALDWKNLGNEGANFGNSFVFDLGCHDERQAFKYVLSVARKEGDDARPCLVDSSWSAGPLPETWQEEWTAEMPTAGKLSCTYATAEAENAAVRKDLAQSLLGW